MPEVEIPNVGALVMFLEPEWTEYEYLFEEPNNLDPNLDTRTLWIASDGPGIVLEVRPSVAGYKPYARVKILAGEKIGWCYADYVEVVK